MGNFILSLYIVGGGYCSHPSQFIFKPINDGGESPEIAEADLLPFALPGISLDGFSIMGLEYEGTELILATTTTTTVRPTTTTTTTTAVPAFVIDALMDVGRYDEAIEIIIEQNTPISVARIFTDEEQDRVISVFKAGINFERERFRQCTKLLGRSISTRDATTIGELTESVNREISARALRRYCSSLIHIISNQLTVACGGMMMFSVLRCGNNHALLGDLYRYISEVTVGEEKTSAQRSGLQMYGEALRMYYSMSLPVTHPDRLRTTTSRELLLYTVPALRRDAISSLEMTLRELDRELRIMPPSYVSRDQWNFVALLEERLKMWKESLQDEEWVVI